MSEMRDWHETTSIELALNLANLSGRVIQRAGDCDESRALWAAAVRLGSVALQDAIDAAIEPTP